MESKLRVRSRQGISRVLMVVAIVFVITVIVQVWIVIPNLLEPEPEIIMEYFNRGVDLAIEGRFEEASEHFDKALEIDPQYKEAWKNKGDALSKLGRFDEAIESYDKALEIDPQYRGALKGKEDTLRARG